MSNTESRIRGVAQRALALFMALILVTTLTPSFALAQETSATVSSAAEQNASADTASESKATSDADSASKADTSASASKKAEAPDAAADSAEKAPAASSASNATDSSASKSADQAASTPATTSGNEPAEQAGGTEVKSVTATLLIDTHIGAPLSMCFTIEEGKTVEDLLDLAVKDGRIDSYTHGTPYGTATSYFVSAITINGVEYGPVNDGGFYWASPSKYDATGINETHIEGEDFSYELEYKSWKSPETTNYPTTPDAKHPDTAAATDNTSYVKSNGNVGASDSAPTTSSNATLGWKKTYGSGNFSDILTIGDSIYFASSLYNADWSTQTGVLHRLNSKGEEVASLELFGTIDFTCRIAYTKGVIVVPLSNGRLQGVSASEMKTLWVSDAIASGAQNISSIAAIGDTVFTGTTNSLDNNWNAASGTFFAINAITGERIWANEESETGFYWAGACKVGSVLLYGNDAGVLTAVSPATGKVVSTLKLSSSIRSTVIANNDGTGAYVTTNDGSLHKIAVAADGSLSEVTATSFCTKSTSTATLFEGNLFVGGNAADYSGTFSVIDAATMKVKNTVSLPFAVQSAPLVAKAADGKTYAYFTCNGVETDNDGKYTSGGGAWVYCLESNTVTKLFDATGEMAEYCNKSIVMGADGTLYWTNDSGTLFALANAASEKNNEPQTPSKPNNENGNDKPNPNNNSNSDSNKQTTNGSNKPGNSGGAFTTQEPLTAAELDEENAEEAVENASDEDAAFGVDSTSTSTAHKAASDKPNAEQQIPWLPITSIAVGCAGLIGVGVYLFRRRSL